MDEAEEDVLAFMAFPDDHRTKLHSPNPLERVNKEIKRSTHVVGLRGLMPPHRGDGSPSDPTTTPSSAWSAPS